MKKMRKLVPAFAMLMVAAIMMSTASFAWFTMNDQVTASGMQVQAKASGNLLISKAPMAANASDIKVDFLDTGKVDLIPVTFVPANSGAVVGSHVTSGGMWKDAAGVKVDPLYGTVINENGNALKDITPKGEAEGDDHFAEYVVYLATAGEAFVGTLQFDLEAVANATSDIANAYTVALYVEGGNGIDWTKPAYVYNQLTNKTDNSAFVDTGVTVNVPSTYGKVADTAVGLKIVIRIYVDGALEAPDKTVDGGPTIQAIAEAGNDGKYDATEMADYTFYTDAKGTAPYVGELENGQSFANLGIVSFWDGESYDADKTVDVTYVNNATVPSTGTSFAFDFKVQKAQ